MAKTTLNGLNADKVQAILDVIIEKSEGGHLITESEIYECAAKKVPCGDARNLEKGVRSILNTLIKAKSDIRALESKDGTKLYFSSRRMTDNYATMLLQKRDNEFQLIADVVRQNSKDYPRPVPLDMFCERPFEFSNQTIMEALAKMSANRSYRDIVSMTTSTSRIFLYSSRHLEHDHASMLAEWFDVGRHNNP